MSIGQRLKDARIARNMTQEDLATAVGVTKGAIGNYETEVSSPKETILIKLMDVLRVDANYLYQDFMDNDNQLSKDELRLLSAYRSAEPAAQRIALQTLENNPKKDTKPSAI